MEGTSVLAITKNGIALGERLQGLFPDWDVFAPAKLSTGAAGITWYSEPTGEKITELFRNSNALVCVFSLGAVIRLVAPHLRDKKVDPAVIVIDDRASFVISALSGHIGGANELAGEIAGALGAVPVITTAADVNNTIAVDLVGRKLGWVIDDDSAVTRISAHMVNGEPIGIFQDAGSRDWQKNLPRNVTVYQSMAELREANPRACLIVSDREVGCESACESVIYRPPSLVVGVGLHWDTPKETIREGIATCMERFGLSTKSVAKLVSIKKPKEIEGLAELGREMEVPVEYIGREELALVPAPNPSDTVRAFEGTASVSEAAAIKASGGGLVVEKQKFPPNLTIAIARVVD